MRLALETCFTVDRSRVLEIGPDLGDLHDIYSVQKERPRNVKVREPQSLFLARLLVLNKPAHAPRLLVPSWTGCHAARTKKAVRGEAARHLDLCHPLQGRPTY